ncbi:MAG: PKD domain-containing protein, partial [Bacteroidia bacterium]|nr:PKD domain-containing protein [Bacteroidia bacterium]
LSEVAVVAVDDNTVVEITPPAGAVIVGYSGPFPIIRTLDRGQVYQIQSNNDLTGTRVRLTGTDCRRFAVFSGNKCTQVGNQPRCDMLYEQMFPLNTLGKTYCTIPFATRDADIFRFLAVEDNTNLVINGGAPIVLNAGQYYTTGAVSQPLYVEADKPIMAAQYSRSACTDAANAAACAVSSDQVYADPFYIMLSAVEQMIIRECNVSSLNLPNISNNFINVLVRTPHVNLVTIDGTNVGALFQTVPANPAFSYLQYETTQGNHVIRCDSGLVAYVYGFGERESYGYAGDVVLNNIALRIVTSADQAGLARECADSLITFTGINQGVVTSWQWDFGDGSPTVSGQVVSHAYSQPGTYFVKLRVTTPSICNVDSSIRQIDIFRPDYSVVNLSPAACGQPTGAATLALAGGVAPYQYAIGNGPFQNAGADNQASLTGLSSGPVVVRFRDAIGCAFVDTRNIPEATDLVLSGQITHVSCFGGADGSVSLTAQGGTPPYLYRLGTGSLQPSNVFPGLSAGTYQFFVVDVNNCSQSLTVQVQQPDQPFTVSIEATANTICAGQSVTLSASPAVSYFWQPGNFTGSAYSPSPGATTTYTLRALNENGCEAVAEYTVEVYNPCPCFWEGIINRYAAVSAVDYCLNTADVADDGAFSPGDTVMLIQMTGAQINLSNTPDFGTITDLGKTGNFEW